MRTFNVGDKVRIKDINWWMNEKNSTRNFTVRGFNNTLLFFQEDMLNFLGKSATVVKVGDFGYKIKINGYGISPYTWSEEVLEDDENKSDDLNELRARVASNILSNMISNQDIMISCISDNSSEDVYIDASIRIADKLIDKLKR